MSDISEEELKYLAENADRIVPYIPPGYFARINAKAKADRERKKEEEEENNKKKNAEEKNDEGDNNEDMNDEEGNEKNEGWGGYPHEGAPIIFHLSHFDYDKDGNLVPRVGPKTLALHYDEETGDYVGEVIAKVEPEEVEEQEVEQDKAKEQTKQLSSKPVHQRKPRTNLSLLKPIPAFPGYKDPDLRIKEDWTLPVDQVDWKALHYREVMRSREMGEWHRSQYKLAVKDRKKVWKKASRRLKEGRGVVMTEVVQEPDQLEV
ncbi:hypothetical protein CGCS363_v002418 [Colletotrichum siamense]|uniref:uncharacterized protein n=1 Tax=Colletotrichum siamense TaxID=690259 RepID=UPI0018725290|nr:uncharacterized protein CGCS363_v002418 [Colletotrichum siamense]KAF5511026.1 hypothetical protein CGCS363_v002418 [Colletotrichum siamense]